MKKKKRPEKIPAYTKIPGWAVAAFITAMPLLAVPVELILTEPELLVVPNVSGIIIDAYQRFREIIIFLLGAGLLLFWLGERIFPDKPLPSPLMSERGAVLPMICCGGYFLFAVISAVFSEYGMVSFWGIASENEGIAAIFGYIMLFFAAYSRFRGDNRLLLYRAALASSAVISVLFIAERIAGTDISKLLFGFENDFAGSFLLFGNPIACGEFCVLLFPVLFLCGLSEDKAPLRAAYLVAGGMLLCVIASTRSTSAFVGLSAAVLMSVAVIIIRRKEMNRKKLMYSPLVLLALAVMLIADPQGTLSSITAQAENRGVYDPAESCHLRDIDITENAVLLDCEDYSVAITLTDENTAVITGTDGELLAELENSAAALGGEYSPVSVSLCDRLLILDLGYKDTIEFETTGGQPIYIGLNGYLVPEPSKSAFPELSQYYRFATGRGYIWLSSVPLLKECVFKGLGAGQFAFGFPQDDIVGMLNTHGTTAICTDKPHNMYLNAALSNGIPALLLLLCLTVVILRRGCWDSSMGLRDSGLAVSVVCFLIMGLVNDSNVNYSPLFWIFAGTISQPEARH